MSERRGSGTGRQTASIVGVVLLLLGVWNYHRGCLSTSAILGAVAGLLFAVALLAPTWARRFHAFWMRTATTVGRLNGYVILPLAYYAAITPYGVLLRLVGRTPISRSPRRPSYWVPRERPRQSKAEFERPF